MMERLTKRDADGQAVMDCQKCKADWTGKHGKPMEECTALYCRNRVKDRLAEHEDLGLTPEQCENAKVIIEAAFSDDTSKAERIRELLKADKEGRLVVLPCVKYCEQYRWQNITWDNRYGICAGCHNTREEAEKALEAMKNE